MYKYVILTDFVYLFISFIVSKSSQLNLRRTILDGHCRRSLLCQALVAWPRLRQWEEGDGCDGAKLEDAKKVSEF